MADDMPVELVEVFRRDPMLLKVPAADVMNLEQSEVTRVDLESCHVSHRTVWSRSRKPARRMIATSSHQNPGPRRPPRFSAPTDGWWWWWWILAHTLGVGPNQMRATVKGGANSGEHTQTLSNEEAVTNPGAIQKSTFQGIDAVNLSFGAVASTSWLLRLPHDSLQDAWECQAGLEPM
jgi:hypothetical protein